MAIRAGTGALWAVALCPFLVGTPALGQATVSNQMVTTQAPPSTGCVLPTPATSFLTTDNMVYLFFWATITTSDSISNNWLAPDGTIVAGENWPSQAGYFCFGNAPGLDISDLPASQLGSWQARVYDNGNLLFSVPFTVAAPQSITVTNAASLAAEVSPGSLVSISGNGNVLATTTVDNSAHLSWIDSISAQGDLATAQNLPLPTSANGTSVTMNGILCPLIYVSPGHIVLQAPMELEPGPATVTVNNNGQDYSTTIQVPAAAPGIFTRDGDGSPGIFRAGRGSSVTMYFTGIGPITNNPGTGNVASGSPSWSQATSTVSITFNGISVQPSFTRLAPGFVGLGEVNFQLPANTPSGNSIPVVLTINGVSSNTAHISVAVSTSGRGVAVTISPTSATVQTGGTQQFTATVTGTSNTSVTWSVSGIQGGNSTVGTVSASGLYTAPGAVPSPDTVTVSAASIATTPAASGSATVTITSPSANPGAAGMTDTNGVVTLTSNGLTVPVQLTDQDTGAPLTGVAVALGNDPTVPGSAVLLIADPSGAHPLQLVMLEGPPAASGGAAAGRFSISQSATSPTPVPVSTGCPLGSGTTASTAITLNGLPTPPSPPTAAGVQTQLVDALSALFSNPSAIPPGFYGPVSVQQFTATVAGDCLNDLSTLTQQLAKEGAEHYYLNELLGPVVASAVAVAGLRDLRGDVISAFQSCWYQTGSPRTINITTVCFGINCILIPQVVPLPTASSWLDYGVGVVVDPAGESLQTFENTEILGLSVVGNTDTTGTGTVQVPAGTNTVCVDSPGYQKYTLPEFTVSAPGTPLDVTLTPISGVVVTISPTSATVQAGATQQFTATVTGSSHTAVTWSATAGTISATGLYTAPSAVSPNMVTAKATRAADTTTATVTATSVADTTKSASATVTITEGSNPAPLTFSVGELPDATVGVPYTFSFCTPTPGINGLCGSPQEQNPSGGQPPYHFQLGTMGGFPPMGMSLSLNGLLTGTSTYTGTASFTASFTVCAVDLSATSVCQPVSLTVNPASSSLTGTWSGNATESAGGCSFAGTMSWTLTEASTAGSGINLTGTLSYNLSLTSGDPDDCGTTASSTDTLAGAVSGNAIILTGGNGETFTATVSGTTITGTGQYTGQYMDVTWSYSLTEK